jgi:hypothetical protein
MAESIEESRSIYLSTYLFFYEEEHELFVIAG